MKTYFRLTIAFILTITSVNGQVSEIKDTSEIKVRGNPIYFIDGVKVNSADSIETQARLNTKRLIIYSWGLQKMRFDHGYYDCEESVSKKYGFVRQAKGCVISFSEERQWKRHNRIVHRKLKRLNGRNWRKQYEKDMTECLKK